MAGSLTADDQPTVGGSGASTTIVLTQFSESQRRQALDRARDTRRLDDGLEADRANAVTRKRVVLSHGYWLEEYLRRLTLFGL